MDKNDEIDKTCRYHPTTTTFLLSFWNKRTEMKEISQIEFNLGIVLEA